MLVHHVDVSEIRVGQDDLAGGLPRDQVVELFSATMAMPSGYNGPAIEAGQRRSSMPGIWAAVKATASVESSWRTTVLKSVEVAPSGSRDDSTTLELEHGAIIAPGRNAPLGRRTLQRSGAADSPSGW